MMKCQPLSDTINDLATDQSGTWFMEAALLVAHNRNLQSMDTSLCLEFERRSGPLSYDQKIQGIAEFHRLMLKKLDATVPSKKLTSGDIFLDRIHELHTFSNKDSKKASDILRPSREYVATVVDKIKFLRPELIDHIELDRLNFRATGKPEDYEPKFWTASTAVLAFCQNMYPDLDAIDCSSLSSCVVNYIIDPSLINEKD